MEPQSRPPVFRVFVSSTFGDFKQERDYLQEHSFRRLREFCESRGAHFQAIDLRWGISEEAGFDQRTMQLCIHELHRCQQITPKPNFVLLLGQRYGWRPLPAVIPAPEFDAIFEAIQDAGAKAILERWYQLDENALPDGERVLRPREGDFRNRERWKTEEAEIALALLAGLEAVDWAPYDSRRDKFWQSATHQEIVEGALQVPENVRQHVFAYFRHLEGLPYDSSAAPYRDVDERRENEDSPRELEALKSSVREVLPPGHTREFSGTWEDGEADFDLAALSDQIESDLRETIERQLDEYAAAPAADRENEEHLRFATDRTKFFEGRIEPLKTLADFVSPESKPEHNTLILCGPSGAGKSALMSQAFLDAAETYGEEAVAIGRFIGATPTSQNVVSLLFDLVSQLCLITGDEAVRGNVVQLESALETQLAKACESTRVLLFIDAADQLDEEGDPETLNWLPNEVPDRGRLVVSMLDRAGEPAGAMLERARNLTNRFDFLELGGIEAEVGSKILDRWLNDRGRRLMEEQRSAVLDLFEKNRLGLYLKLLFERAVSWKSYDPAAQTYENLSATIPELLDRFFDDLARPENHDIHLVERVFGFLAASRSGLSEDEVLALLHADRDFYDWFRENARHAYYEQPDQALPVVLWSRFHQDCAAYITERFGDGRILFTFYHRQVAEAAARRFLTESVRLGLADFFQTQPGWLNRERRIPNLRRTSELTYQLEKAEQWDRMVTVLEDLEFVSATISAGRKFEVLFQIAAAFARAKSRGGATNLIDLLIRLGISESTPLTADEIHATYVYRIVREGTDDPAEKVFYEAFLKRATDERVLAELLKDESENVRTETRFTYEINHSGYHRRQRNMDEAREIGARVMPQVEAYAEEHPHFRKQLSTIQYDFGYLDYLEGNPEQSLELMEKSAKSAGREEYPDSYAFSMTVGAAIAYRCGIMTAEEALSHHDEMEKVFLANPDPGNFTSRCIMNIWAHRAEIYYMEGYAEQFSKALDRLEQDRWVIQFGGEMMLRLRALKSQMLGEEAKALELYREWLEKNGLPVESPRRYLYELSAILSDAGELSEAGETLERALKLPESDGNYIWKTLCRNLANRIRKG